MTTRDPRSPRPLRVLHVIQNLNYGGMERVLADIVLRADPARFESHVLCLQYAGRFAQGLERASTLHLGPRMSPMSMLRPTALASQIRAIAPDVVHTHSGVWHKASLAARMAGVPWVVHTEHGRQKPDPWQSRLVDGIAARRTDRVVAVSDLLAAELPRALWITPEKIARISNGVDTDAYHPRVDDGKLRRELALAPDTPIIGSIGRLEPIKGYDIMIEAMAILRREPAHREAVLVIGGAGSQREALDARISELGIACHVQMLGWRDDVHDMHAAFDIFTMSSRSEGTSISLLEAMSAGLPPVVTDVGGNAAVLGEGLAVQSLVPTEDPTALAARWGSFLEARERRERVAEQARARVVAAFGLDAMVCAYERLYETGVAVRAGVSANAVRGVPPSPRNSALRPPVI